MYIFTYTSIHVYVYVYSTHTKESLHMFDVDLRIASSFYHSVSELCLFAFSTATSYNSPQHTVARCSTLQHTATHCTTLQHTATNCNAPFWTLPRRP